MSHISPLNWLSLSSLFILSYILFILINYFTYIVSVVDFSPLIGVNFLTISCIRSNYNNFFRYYNIKSNDRIYYDRSFLLLSGSLDFLVIPSYMYSYSVLDLS